MDQEESPQAILESTTGADWVRYTGSGPGNKNLNLNRKYYYHCNYNRLKNSSFRLTLKQYKILNRNQTVNKYNLNITY